MTKLVRQRSFLRSPRCMPGTAAAAAVAIVLAAFALFLRRHASDTSGAPDSDGIDPADSVVDHGDKSPHGDAGCEDSYAQVQSGEAEGELDREEVDSEDDGYVVLTDAEIGPAVERACSSPELVECSTEVRKAWGLLAADHRLRKDTCARIYDVLRTKDAEAAVLLGERLSWHGREGEFDVMVSTIIETSDKSSRLGEVLMSLGEKHFATGVKDSHTQSLSEALVTAVEEALGERESPAPSTVKAWKDFFSTVLACMMLAGAGAKMRWPQQDKAEPALDLPGSEGTHSAVCTGWKRESGLLNYRLPQAAMDLPIAPKTPKLPTVVAAGMGSTGELGKTQ